MKFFLNQEGQYYRVYRATHFQDSLSSWIYLLFVDLFNINKR